MASSWEPLIEPPVWPSRTRIPRFMPLASGCVHRARGSCSSRGAGRHRWCWSVRAGPGHSHGSPINLRTRPCRSSLRRDCKRDPGESWPCQRFRKQYQHRKIMATACLRTSGFGGDANLFMDEVEVAADCLGARRDCRPGGARLRSNTSLAAFMKARQAWSMKYRRGRDSWHRTIQAAAGTVNCA